MLQFFFVLQREHVMTSKVKRDASDLNQLLRECAATLQSVANYRLPAAMDQRLVWLAENKERLHDAEQQELLALSEFAEQRTSEKVRSQAILQRITAALPDAMPS
jgi:predicted exporter